MCEICSGVSGVGFEQVSAELGTNKKCKMLQCCLQRSVEANNKNLQIKQKEIKS